MGNEQALRADHAAMVCGYRIDSQVVHSQSIQQNGLPAAITGRAQPSEPYPASGCRGFHACTLPGLINPAPKGFPNQDRLAPCVEREDVGAAVMAMCRLMHVVGRTSPKAP